MENENEVKPYTWQQLKSFCNSLNEEQLQTEVHLAQDDSSSIKVGCACITEEDEYFDHTDSLGTLEQIKAEYPDSWEDIIEDAICCPKGTVMLLDEG